MTSLKKLQRNIIKSKKKKRLKRKATQSKDNNGIFSEITIVVMATSNANVNLPRLSSWITWYIRGLKTTTTSRNILFLLRPILNMATALWEEENEIKITLWKCAEILQPLMHVVKRGWKDWGRSYWAQTSCDFLRCNNNTCRPLTSRERI